MELPPEFETLHPILKWAITVGFLGAGAIVFWIEHRKKILEPAKPPALIQQDIDAAIKTTEARAEAAEAEASRLRQDAALENVKQDIIGEIGRTRQMLRELLAPIAKELADLRREIGVRPRRRS